MDGRGVAGRADDPGVIWSQDAHLASAPAGASQGLPWEASFALTRDEADFLRGRLEESCAGTLLAWLARNGSDVPAETAWDDPDALRAPASVRETLELARRFSLHVEGMPLLYNLVVRVPTRFVQKYTARTRPEFPVLSHFVALDRTPASASRPNRGGEDKSSGSETGTIILSGTTLVST